MNIYMTGAHGCGKTTTASKITLSGGFEALPSVARSSPYESGTPENQRYIMNKIYDRCLRRDKCIHERTPLDVLSYTRLMGMESEYQHQEMKLEAFFRFIKGGGGILFYFPILFPLVEDGVRPGKHEQIQIDDFIRKMLIDSGVLFLTVPSGTPEERADFILERVT